MQAMSAEDAKDLLGRLIDKARAEPVIVHRRRRPVVAVLSVEEFDPLRAEQNGTWDRKHSPDETASD